MIGKHWRAPVWVSGSLLALCVAMVPIDIYFLQPASIDLPQSLGLIFLLGIPAFGFFLVYSLGFGFVDGVFEDRKDGN